eukprot:CAMPEP_0172323268 /NCGR_PEP_ID=MMETSP1058-20130122/48289_1 /TAXON_ID=83371 /ORGANISM="Detonula confervacea, Strain CCMP 353" /LENGTH=398 /DNA_ID=CAMNT_0013039225 /DNA_START=173 /DNA_END=1369 /DNA_ORIENTATION=+
MVSSCILSFAIASLADSILQADSHPSSTWSTIHHGQQLHRRQQWGGHTDRIRHVMRNGLYRRGGSNGTGIGNLSTYYEEQINGTNATATSILSSLTGGQPLLYSTCSVQGERQYMEDEYFVEQGRFAAVFDGHGGAAVSKYLRQNLYANFQAALPTSASLIIEVADDDKTQNEVPTQADAQSSIVASALETAFDKVDSEVGNISHWSFQGSTALAVVLHENVANGTRSIVTANVGDSRAIISHGRTAIDLTKDHKPNDSAERERIEALDGTVDWCGKVDRRGDPVEHTGVYRINGNLALSRAIGDRSERPWVTNSVDLAHHIIDEDNDSFVLLATDGLFDVMSSQDVVTFIHEMMDSTHPEHRHELRRDIAKYVVAEALKRGSNDNITVLVLWINEEN